MERLFILITWVLVIFVLVECEPRLPSDPFKGIEDKNSKKPKSDDDDFGDLPFEDIATRAPMTVQEREREIYRKGMEELNKPIEMPRHHRRRRPHRPGGYYRPAIGGAIYNIYPIMYPKGADYCPQMRGIFRFTCQPSKPLRLDLVEFCKEYSAFCGVINTHRLPGPGTGPPPIPGAIGHIGVSGNFGFGIGSVPGLEVNAGWGVDVGPIPGVGESVGVNVDSGVQLLGASPPLKYRRGQDKPTDAKSGLVGVSGGVGVSPGGGTGPIGVGTGVGVG